MAKTLTVDGSEAQTVLSNLTPGVTYEVTIVAIKGQRESEPGSDSVTTGEMCDGCCSANNSLGQNRIRTT